MEQQSPIPPKSRMKAHEKRAIFPSLIWGGGRGGLGFPFILSKIVGSVQCWPTDHACRCIFLVFKGFVFVCSRAMIKGQGGQVFLSGYYELDPWLLSKYKQKKNRTKRNHQLFDLSPIWTRRKCGSLDHGHQGVKMRLEKTREERKNYFLSALSLLFPYSNSSAELFRI